MSPDCVVGIDIGTTSVRVTIYNSDGNQVAEVEFRMTLPIRDPVGPSRMRKDGGEEFVPPLGKLCSNSHTCRKPSRE